MQTGSILILGVSTSTQDDASANEGPSAVAPPWTAAPAAVTSPLPYGVACGTPAALFATTPAAAAEPTPATNGELPAADAAAAKLTAALESLINVPLYAVRSCIDTVPYRVHGLSARWPTLRFEAPCKQVARKLQKLLPSLDRVAIL